jgi:hypothetical protein
LFWTSFFHVVLRSSFFFIFCDAFSCFFYSPTLGSLLGPRFGLLFWRLPCCFFTIPRFFFFFAPQLPTRGPQDPPRAPQDTPKMSQGLPKRHPRPPKTSQDAAKTTQDTTKTSLSRPKKRRRGRRRPVSPLLHPGPSDPRTDRLHPPP